MSPTLTAPCPAPLPGILAREIQPRNWNHLPVPEPGVSHPPRPTAAPLPSWPNGPAAAKGFTPAPWPSALSALPIAPVHHTPPPEPTAVSSRNPVHPDPDFTDEDLRQALVPILQTAVRQAIHASGIDNDLEPMLRATMRRTLAEQSSGTRPFHPPGVIDRMIWHFQALFSSRTYEDIFFEKTHRFQVEEVFLVDVSSLALVSFASCNPARHASAKRVGTAVQLIALQLRDEHGKIRETIDLDNQRHAISRQARFVILIAVIRGKANDLVTADLEFGLRRIEDRFVEQFKNEGSPLLHVLQPFLEECVLIQAPASAA
jgi:hypothetical protein